MERTSEKVASETSVKLNERRQGAYENHLHLLDAILSHGRHLVAWTPSCRNESTLPIVKHETHATSNHENIEAKR